MNEETSKAVAAQLRQPQGAFGIQVGEKMNEGNLHINLSTIEALKLKAGYSVLEIGMGNGFFAKDILSVDKSIKYTGVDFSETMVTEASVCNAQFIKEGRAQFSVANAEKIPFTSETFDKVFTVNTIYFWDNQQIVLSEIRRVLKPKGQIIISVRPKSVMEQYPFTKYGFTMFTKEDLVNLLTANNFTVTAAMEKEEPSQEINGEKIRVETLIVCAEK